MFPASVTISQIISPFKVKDLVKINAKKYCKFLDKIFFGWYNSQPKNFGIPVMVVTHFAKKCFKEAKLMECPPTSLYIKLIDNKPWQTPKQVIVNIFNKNRFYILKILWYIAHLDISISWKF